MKNSVSMQRREKTLYADAVLFDGQRNDLQSESGCERIERCK